MPTYFFQLGNTPQLSNLELEALLSLKPEPISSQLSQLTTQQELDLDQLQKKTGGVVKSWQAITPVISDSTTEIEQQIANYLQSQADTTQLQFSVSSLGAQPVPQIELTAIKKLLRQQGVKSRYLNPDRLGLSAAVLLHQDVVELAMINTGRQLFLAQTMTIQDIDDWAQRDRSKPYADRRKGMLPPKVARMMINITLSHLLAPKVQPLLYDPFCGSGTILMEAVLRNCQVKGADLDPTAVQGCDQNLRWLLDIYQLQTSFSVEPRDAVQPFANSTRPSVDCLVTEPFLGKPTPQEKELPNIFKGLYRLYLGSFKNWTQILKSGASLSVVFPLVKAKNKTYTLQKIIDKLPQLGYTTLSQPVIYSRPQAVVERQLHFLRYKET